jgi:hypothetical protein
MVKLKQTNIFIISMQFILRKTPVKIRQALWLILKQQCLLWIDVILSIQSKQASCQLTHIVMDAVNIIRDARGEVREIPLCEVRVTQVASAFYCAQVADWTVLDCIKVWCSFRPLNSKQPFFMTHWHSGAIYNFHIHTLYLICYTSMYHATVHCRFLKQHMQSKYEDLVNNK